jgi:HlyD family secretion protein
METARQAPAELPSSSPALAPLAQAARARMGWGKRTAAIAFGLAVVALVAVSLWPRPPPPIGVQTAVARRSAITRKVTAAGKLQAATQVKLSSNVSGDLLELPVKEGDRVAKGQLIGRIDSRRYLAQLRQQEANRATAAADQATALVNVARLQAELQRVKRLAGGGNASAAELDKAQQDLAAEQSRAVAAKERVAQADAQLAEARQLLSYTTLLAPIDGVVTSRLKQVGERVRGGELQEDPIVIIATLSNMEVKVEVGEHEVVHLHEGDNAEVEIDAIPDKRWPAAVLEIAKNANVRNPNTEQEVTTFPVRLALTVPVPGALPGMSAQASISTETHDDAVVVPLQAVTVRTEKELKGEAPTKAQEGALAPPAAAQARRREAARKVVFVVEKGTARVRPVETGLAGESEIEILEGLKEGETVVEGPYKVLARELADGKPVRPLKPGEGVKLP